MRLFGAQHNLSRVGVITLSLVVLIAGLAGWWSIHHHAADLHTAGIKQQAAAKAADAKKKEEAAKQAIAAAFVQEKAAEKSVSEWVNDVVHKGEGVENPLIRQLEADPSIVNDRPASEHFTGNLNNSSAVKRWAGHEAAVLAGDSGIVGRFGEQYRILVPNIVAFKLVKDPESGGIKIVEFAASVLVTKAATAKIKDSTTEFEPPTSAAAAIITLAGMNFSQVASFRVAPTASGAKVPFVTRPSGDIVFHSLIAYIYDGTPEG